MMLLVVLPDPRRFQPIRHPMVRGIFMLGLVTALGTLGYLVVEDGWTLLDAFYMTVITITTVGYREVHPLGPASQLFTSALVVAGLSVLLYTLARVGQAVVEGELADVFGRRRMMNQIAALEGHTVVCGFGKVGRPVAEGLASQGLPFVVVESSPDLQETLRDLNYLHVGADATDDTVLERAGTHRASTLLSLLPSDADNLYVTVTARDMNPRIKVIARAHDPRAEVRLKRGGADVVVSPARIAGLRVLQAAVNPTAVEVMEIVTKEQAMQLSLADVRIDGRSFLVGKTIGDAGIRSRYRVIVVAIKREQGMLFNPEPTTAFATGDVLVVLGEDRDIAQLQSAAT